MAHWITAFLGKYAGMDLVDRNEIINMMIEAGHLERVDGETIKILDDAAGIIFKARQVDPVDIVEEYEKNGNVENIIPKTKNMEQDLPRCVT